MKLILFLFTELRKVEESQPKHRSPTHVYCLYPKKAGFNQSLRSLEEMPWHWQTGHFALLTRHENAALISGKLPNLTT